MSSAGNVDTLPGPTWMRDALEQKRQERLDAALRAATHESGHAVANHVAGARVQWVSLVPGEDRVGFTQTGFRGVDLADVLVGFCAGEAALATFGWPNPQAGAGDDRRRAKLAAIQLAHLKGRGKATDPEYLDAVVEAGRREALRLVAEHWQAIDALAQVLVPRLRLAGDELTTALDRAMLSVPAYRQREQAFQAEWNAMNVRLGFARPLRA